MGEETATSPFFVADCVLKRNTLRQCYECRGGKEMSKVAALPLKKESMSTTLFSLPTTVLLEDLQIESHLLTLA
jgi:hypothetical protein